MTPKFRVWDKHHKKICTVNEINFNRIGQIDLLNIGGICAPGDRTVRGIREIDLLQYTGLKDKNGVEIYEGIFLK